MSNEIDTQSLLTKIDGVLGKADMPERHTFFQMKCFIIGKECTNQGRLWQIIRELRSRRETLESLELQILDTEYDIALLELEKESGSFGDYDQKTLILKRKYNRKIESMRGNVQKLRQKAEYVGQEVTYLLQAFDALSAKEPLKPLDDIQAQREYWNEKLLEEFNLRMLLRRPLDSDFVKTVMSIDTDLPVKEHMTKVLGEMQKQAIEKK